MRFKQVVFDECRARQYVQSPRGFFTLAVWLILLVTVAVLALIFIPWQQTIVGEGKVTVFAPMQRPQTVEAQISGRLKLWHVNEGDVVAENQLIAELADIDPKFMAVDQLEALKVQYQALVQKRQATEKKMMALQAQVKALSQSRSSAIPSAGQKISENRAAVEAAEQALATAQYNFDRTQTLYEKGLKSKRDLELAELSLVKSQTDLRQASAKQSGAQLDQEKVSGDTAASLSSAMASIASAQESIATADSDIAKLIVDIQTLEQRIAQRQITAPARGRVVRMLQVGKGQTVSSGEVMALIVPESIDQAVELYISAWDVPLVREGRPVRLQFDGWPAVQFSGWPMVATGTFGGVVSVIDAVDDGLGRYRLLVRPDYEAIKAGFDEPWPDPKYLRAGAGAKGWILLNNVPLGYELWRQFNAFPPGLQAKPDSKAAESEEQGKMLKSTHKTSDEFFDPAKMLKRKAK